MKKLSIVIPVYNVEKYVEKCIESCLAQNAAAEDYEIIIINDGSTDNSLEIVNTIARNYSNIFVFSQENLGLSVARNKGLSLAKGEYVWFIDSDDWIVENCLQDILKALNGEIDVLALGYVKSYDDSLNNEKFPVPVFNAYKGIDLLKKGFIMPAQFYIYNREFLKDNNLVFEPGLIHEDFDFTPRMLYVADNLTVYDQLVYFFYKRPGSLTTSVNPKRSFDLLKIASRLISFEKLHVEERYKYIYHNLAFLALNNSLHNSLKMDVENLEKLRLKFYDHNWLFKYLKKSTVFKYRIERILFLLFPKNTITIYKLLKLIK